MILERQVKDCHFFVYIIPVCSQTVQETKAGQFSLHPVSVNDSQAAFPPLLPRVGFTTRLWGSPLTPGAVFSKSQLFCFFFFRAPSLSPSIHPSTDCSKNNGLFSCASAPLRGLWLGSAAGLRFQPHVLHSNQKSQPWQYGRIAEGDAQRKSASREEGEGRRHGGGVRKRGGENKTK